MNSRMPDTLNAISESKSADAQENAAPISECVIAVAEQMLNVQRAANFVSLYAEFFAAPFVKHEGFKRWAEGNELLGNFSQEMWNCMVAGENTAPRRGASDTGIPLLGYIYAVSGVSYDTVADVLTNNKRSHESVGLLHGNAALFSRVLAGSTYTNPDVNLSRILLYYAAHPLFINLINAWNRERKCNVVRERKELVAFRMKLTNVKSAINKGNSEIFNALTDITELINKTTSTLSADELDYLFDKKYNQVFSELVVTAEHSRTLKYMYVVNQWVIQGLLPQLQGSVALKSAMIKQAGDFMTSLNAMSRMLTYRGRLVSFMSSDIPKTLLVKKKITAGFLLMHFAKQVQDCPKIPAELAPLQRNCEEMWGELKDAFYDLERNDFRTLNNYVYCIIRMVSDLVLESIAAKPDILEKIAGIQLLVSLVTKAIKEEKVELINNSVAAIFAKYVKKEIGLQDIANDVKEQVRANSPSPALSSSFASSNETDPVGARLSAFQARHTLFTPLTTVAAPAEIRLAPGRLLT